MKYLMLIMLSFTLIGCQSAEEKKADWIKFCVDGEFTVKQCNVLYSLKQSSDDANDNASTAAAMSGVAIGMSAGARR